MFIAIVQHTPVWVWGLFIALLAAGLAQTRPRELGLARVTLLPLLLIGLSLAGVFSAFGHAPIAFGGWSVGASAAFACARHAVAVRGARWSSATRTLHVPGSWWPLALMVGLFAVKYGAGASLALNPALARDAVFAGLCSAAYGTVSGLFLARALSLRNLATAPGSLQTA